MGGRAATLLGVVLLHAALILGLLVVPGRMPHGDKPLVETFVTLIAVRPPAPVVTPASARQVAIAPKPSGLRAPARMMPHPAGRKTIRDPCAAIIATDPKSPDYRPDCGRPAPAETPPLDLPEGFHLDDLNRVIANAPGVLSDTPQDAAAADALAARQLSALHTAFGPADRPVDTAAVDRLPMIAAEKWQQAEKWNDEFLQPSQFLAARPHWAPTSRRLAPPSTLSVEVPQMTTRSISLPSSRRYWPCRRDRRRGLSSSGYW